MSSDINDSKIICCPGCATPGLKHSCGQQYITRYRPDYHKWQIGTATIPQFGYRIDLCTVCSCTRTVDKNGSAILYELNGQSYTPKSMPMCNR